MLPPTNRIISGISLPPTNAVEELQKPHLEDAVFERDKNETMVVEMIKMSEPNVFIFFILSLPRYALMINFGKMEFPQFTHTCPSPVITCSIIDRTSPRGNLLRSITRPRTFTHRFGIVSRPSVIAIVHTSRYAHGFIALRYRPSCPPSFPPPPHKGMRANTFVSRPQ